MDVVLMPHARRMNERSRWQKFIRWRACKAVVLMQVLCMPLFSANSHQQHRAELRLLLQGRRALI